ncbi:MAG: hypothetical protein EAZ13_07390 [Sphingobacteriia bacterium]|nr:MAG: hypothetical protein EAZ13_07390 [Sphingobacteriia bacterium]
MIGLVIVGVAFSQNSKEDFYVYTKDWSPAKNLVAATFIMHQIAENDTTYIKRYYQKNGPLIFWETYYDKDCTIPDGLFAWYNTKGDLDSTGNCYRGKKTGLWKYGFDKKNRPFIVEEYAKGKLIKRMDFKVMKIFFPNGIEEILDTSSSKSSAVKPPEFENGGINGWVNYLSNNLKTPNRFMSLTKSGIMTSAFVEFEINTDGKIKDLLFYHSLEWSADLEVIRVLRASPRWIPAEIDGKLIQYAYGQQISFSIKDY